MVHLGHTGEFYSVYVDLSVPFTYFDASIVGDSGEILRNYRDLASPSAGFSAKVPATGTLPDIVKTSRLTYSFSSRAKDLISHFGVPDDSRWIEVEFQTRDATPSVMWTLHFTPKYRVSVVDLEHTEATWLLPKKIAKSISRYAIVQSNIPPAGVFADRSNLDVFFRHDVVEEWIRLQFTGLTFKPAKVLDS